MSEVLLREGDFLIRALADHLNGRKTEPPAALDWDVLLQYAAFHKLEGMLFLQCRAILPKDKLAPFGMQGMLQFKDTMKKVALVERIEAAFSARGIPFLVVKGVEVAQFYPAVKERAMGDIDLVVDPADKARAGEVLEQLGAVLTTRKGVYEWGYTLEDVELELHDHLLYAGRLSDEKYAYMERFRSHTHLMHEGSTRLSLDWSFHLVYLLVHLYKHFIGEGVGLRLYMDLALVCQRAPIDIDRLKADLDELGLTTFASQSFAFCERWFGIRMPFSCTLEEDFYTSFTQNVLTTGLYGGVDEFYKNNALSTMQDQGRASALISWLFPSVKRLLENDRETVYTYLKKWPVLLPVAWVQRFLKPFATGTTRTILSTFKHYFKGNTQLDARRRFLDMWGIDERDR